ncbi:dTMP kinase [Nesterenkonia lutea]|uniref:Thymidylate kinase n=1 Tax=Nesterenkonia lutea TaxID=272919 RepID=A0ABR9JBD6_9MICC|nr:dTMP kinase [Nesterenkonia lutea]MBE1523240.1 dTMP kinase [Nesterenkonia lutea]
MNQLRRGGFIAFEGGDGAGKTTQLSLLESWFVERGVPYERTREPGGTPIGERIRSLVLEHGQGEVDPRTEALLFAASRAAHVVQRIRPALESGRFVLCDRYVDSSVAYQGEGRQIGTEAVADVNVFATGGLQPDLTVLLDLEPAAARARREGREGTSDRIESAEDAFHERLRAAFLARAEAEPERYLVLAADGAPEGLQKQIRARVEELLSA